MTAAMRLDEHERARLLGLIGIDRYVRRSDPPAKVEPASVAPATPTPRTTTTRSAAQAVATPAPEFRAATKPASRPSLIDELGLDARAPQVVVFIDLPRTPDPRSARLLDAICRLLPPHQRLDAGDVPARWPATAIALGGRVMPPEGTSLIQAPTLHELRGDVAAKRVLWRAIRRLRRTGRS